MASRTDDTPLVVVLGVTGSGKSALGLELARLFNGEIIAADSRTVYKGMDISTAKPTAFERIAVNHSLIDVADPDQTFTVADFKLKAEEAISSIASRSKLPILVGGTGLYIDALLYNFVLRPLSIDEGLRHELSKLSVEELQERILQNGYEFPKDKLNPRRLIRVIESAGAQSDRVGLRPNTLLLGLNLDRGELRRRLELRVDSMMASGLVDEIQVLSKRYGWEAPALQTPGFKAFRGYLNGELSLDAAKQSFVQNDMNLAKRQYTWFKRNKDVHWVKDKEEAVGLVTTFLSK